MAKAAPKKPLTKTQLMTNIAEASGLSRKEVAAVFDALSAEIKKNLAPRGPGAIAIPGLIKIEKKAVPARKARKGVPDPFHPGQLYDVKAKPASKKIKVRPLKALKDMI
jgi:nucleoid DNA-binding protein